MHKRIAAHLARPNPTSQVELSLVEYLPLVRRIASGINNRLSGNMDMDDLCSAGVLGLIQASAKFNSSKNVPFMAFASFRIRGAILDSLRLLDWAPRELRRKGRDAKNAIQKLTSRFADAPSDEQVAAELGTTLNSYQRLQSDLRSVQVGSLYQKRNPDSEEELIDVAGRPEEDPLHLCQQGEMWGRLTQAIEDLAPRERLITTLYYYEEMTVKEIGLTLNICEFTAGAVRRSAVLHLRKALAKRSPVKDSKLVCIRPARVPSTSIVPLPKPAA